MHVKKGDKVMVISGKDKGKTGVILAAFPKKDRVLVEGVNIIKKHMKPNQVNPQGGIVSQEAAIHVSNVMLIDPKTGEPTRVGYKVEDGKKVRVAKKSGEIIK
ncbi:MULTISPECIES: 50S ribosomal protein L24 [Psychrobacillus]|uniref:Large ribosomal subunit protein uL24 n=1 Tax=Psychrobacillus lasiicapitis TaxID=1636719 RepID=A0A544TCN0_9BACI|nr:MULTISPECIES: 50S ribosomal protein L24 [Psychrobacillus]MDI2586274.1 50S ribosomal protein L24 [Psychrobacillus sp. NEAU-3TGS]TQR15224.1 50S ribosomal protein L24 [Psychrobacillus lasiicapitis]GGA44338.1 50S ribosomal protein L24 [Psychrobacillus lasiicapitis]